MRGGFSSKKSGFNLGVGKVSGIAAVVRKTVNRIEKITIAKQIRNRQVKSSE